MGVPLRFPLGLNRSSYYYDLAAESSENLQLMRLIDKQYLQTPFFGSRLMADWLGRYLHEPVNRKRTQRLMRIMRIEAIYPPPINPHKPDTQQF